MLPISDHHFCSGRSCASCPKWFNFQSLKCILTVDSKDFYIEGFWYFSVMNTKLLIIYKWIKITKNRIYRGIKNYERNMLEPIFSKLMQYLLRPSDLNMKIEEKLYLFLNHALRWEFTKKSDITSESPTKIFVKTVRL